MSKLQALSQSVNDWNQRPYMITGAVLERILIKSQNGDMLKRAKRSKANLSKGFWTPRRWQNLGLWVAFAAAFTGIVFLVASSIANYQARVNEPVEVWTQNAWGEFIPMKHKGDK